MLRLGWGACGAATRVTGGSGRAKDGELPACKYSGPAWVALCSTSGCGVAMYRTLRWVLKFPEQPPLTPWPAPFARTTCKVGAEAVPGVTDLRLHLVVGPDTCVLLRVGSKTVTMPDPGPGADR